MAPHFADDDDFVHTISDNDSGFSDVEREEEDADTAAPTAQSKKRKRDSLQDVSSASKKSKKQGQEEKKKTKKRRKQDGDSEADEGASEEENEDEELQDAGMDSDFEFVPGDLYTGVLEDFDGWENKGAEEGKKGPKAVDVDAIIERRKAEKEKTAGGKEVETEEVDGDFEGLGEDDDELLADDGFGMGVNSDEEGSDDEDADAAELDEEDNDSEEDVESDEDVAAPMPHPDDVESQADSDEEEDEAEAQRRAEFFAAETEGDKSASAKAPGSFQAMSLSRPILKGLAAVGFAEPTPIQAKTIPVALLGKDVVGSAETGSGKTGAFMIPILERLLYRPKKVPTTRVVVLMPTRELAVQCYNVSKKLASYTDITFAQIVGGFSLREQENVLKTRPDVVIATPGRFIDHVRNSPSFAVDTLEIFVLDEADRMLEEGFADELNEIISSIPKSRQTMLFSATMTESIDKLIRAGLNRPVRLQVNAKKQTVAGLVQEFVRLRPGKEDKRLAYLMYLCDKVYTDRVIIFFRQKKEAHRIRVIFGLCGLRAGELHGSMSQEQRIHAIESFRSGTINFLLATDLASRGLDIKNVHTVLNYSTPQTHEIYLHRVGRTARAGRTGHACTLAAEPDRKVVRAAVKAARSQGAKIVSRTVPNESIDEWDEKLSALEEEVEAVLAEEKEEKALSTAERDLTKSENLVKYEAEIKARPKRTWFETEKDKQAAKLKGKVELNGAAAEPKKDKKRKLSGKEKKKLEDGDIRAQGKVWKKGREERAGKGVLAAAKQKKGAKGGHGVGARKGGGGKKFGKGRK